MVMPWRVFVTVGLAFLCAQNKSVVARYFPVYRDMLICFINVGTVFQ